MKLFVCVAKNSMRERKNKCRNNRIKAYKNVLELGLHLNTYSESYDNLKQITHITLL